MISCSGINKQLNTRPEMNPVDDSDYLGAVSSMDGASMMLGDEMFDFIKIEPMNALNNAQEIYIPPAISNIGDSSQQFVLKEELHSLSDGDAGSETPFDPNDFFNELYKSEVSYSPFSSSSYRNTPSPSNSQSSGSDQSSECNSLIGQTGFNFLGGHQKMRRTQDVAPVDSVPTLNTIPEQQTLSGISVYNQMAAGEIKSSKINIIQGTLIPISLSPPHNTLTAAASPAAQLPMKKIKIQPKPAQTTNGIPRSSIQKSNLKPKTIVLTASDYKALMLKCKTQLTEKKNDEITPLTLKMNPIIPNTTTTTVVDNPSKILSVPMTPTIGTKIGDLPSIKVGRMNISSVAKLSVIKHDIDDRALKKQMRMIKNRESACLSRKKKKDYVTSLEACISDLSIENQQLKSENSLLKDRLSNFANQVCDLCGGMSAIKTKSIPLSSFASVPKRNAAFLLAFLFMVSLHVTPYLSNQTPKLSTGDDSFSLSENSLASRRLLWIDDATNSSNASPIADDQINAPLYPMCPVSVNQTESIRLASELQRWIGDFPEYFNISKKAQTKNNFDLNEISDYLLSDDGGRAIKSFYKQMKNVGKHIEQKTKQRALHENLSNRGINSNGLGVRTVDTDGRENRVQVYNEDVIKYAQFFDEIRRQDDTFYVVSFKGDHLLLPAVAHNKTFRPKMSLMLPAVGNISNGSFNDNGMFTLMQIDCEVVNTSILHIKESSIPTHLWNRSQSKKSADENSMPTAEEARKEPTEAQRIIRNLPPDQNVVDKINENKFHNNVTAENRQRSHFFPKVDSTNVVGSDPVNAGIHVAPLKPHRPYFLHKTGDSNAQKLLNEV